MTPRVTVYSKPGCHLCDDAETIVARVCLELSFGWQSVNIIDNPGLAAAYSEQVPVIFVDGHQLDYWRVDEGRLRSALSRS